MKELLDPKPLELEDVIKQYRATGISSIGQTLGAYSNTAVGTVALNSITLGNTTLEESQLQKLLKLQADEGKKKATPR